MATVVASGVIAKVRVFLFVGVPITAEAKDWTVVHSSVFETGTPCSGVSCMVSVAINASFVCLAPFVSLSFACVNLVCFAFSPRLGVDCFAVVPDWLRRLSFRAIVDRSRSCGTVCVISAGGDEVDLSR